MKDLCSPECGGRLEGKWQQQDEHKNAVLRFAVVLGCQVYGDVRQAD